MIFRPLPYLPPPMLWFVGTVEYAGEFRSVHVPALSFEQAEEALNDYCGAGVVDGVLLAEGQHGAGKSSGGSC